MLDLLKELQSDINTYLRIYIDNKKQYKRRSPEYRRAREFIKVRKLLKKVIADYQPPLEVVEENRVVEQEVVSALNSAENRVEESTKQVEEERSNIDNETYGQTTKMDDLDKEESKGLDLSTQDKLSNEEVTKKEELSEPKQPSTFILHSVGKKGRNEQSDTLIVQDLLKQNGHRITVDGICGNGTVKTIVNFQKQVGFKKPDGRVDPGGKTFSYLLSKAKEREERNSKIINTVGYKGANLKEDTQVIQSLLNENGAKLVVDGICGKGTIKAIKNYQKDILSIEKPTGLIDFEDITWQGLKGNLIL